MKPTSIIVHHELGNQGFQGVNEYHRQLWNFKSSLGYFCGYQYYIDKTGKVWQARKDDEEGAHTIGRNNDSIAICLQGNLDVERPTPVQLIALKNLILKKMTEWIIRPNQVFGHRMYANKSCPGRLFPESEVRALFQPDAGYYQNLLNSLKDLLMKLKTTQVGSACVSKETKQ